MDTATKMIPYAKITDPDVKNHEKIISKSFNLKIINGLQVSELHYLPCLENYFIIFTMKYICILGLQWHTSGKTQRFFQDYCTFIISEDKNFSKINLIILICFNCVCRTRH